MFTTVQCGVKCNEEGVGVLWYLHRTDDPRVDGPCWFINSCGRSGSATCEIVSEGFDEADQPVVKVVLVKDVESGSELLLDYMLKKSYR